MPQFNVLVLIWRWNVAVSPLVVCTKVNLALPEYGFLGASNIASEVGASDANFKEKAEPSHIMVN